MSFWVRSVIRKSEAAVSVFEVLVGHFHERGIEVELGVAHQGAIMPTESSAVGISVHVCLESLPGKFS